MNNKGQGFGFIRVLFFAGLFLVLFSLALAPIVTAMLGAGDLSQLGGFGSWVFSNLNIWYFGSFLLVVLVSLVYGYSSE